MTLFLSLEKAELKQLVRHCYAQSKEGTILLIPVDNRDMHLESYLTENGTYECNLVRNKNYKISYPGKDRGIKWLIRFDTLKIDHKSYTVEATINPQILRGRNDYITAATLDDMEVAIENFNKEAKAISPILGRFEDYKIRRIDYCMNLYLHELIPECTSQQIMSLIKRGDIPLNYEERVAYDRVSHRMKTDPCNFYIKSNSITINCYDKYISTMRKSQDRECRNLSPIPQERLDAARDIIRFEVQCKYPRVYTMSKRADAAGNHSINKYKSLLSPIACIDQIDSYYRRTIGAGDWYTLRYAIRKIEQAGFHQQKEARLIRAIKLVNECRSLSKAKEGYYGSDLDSFKRTLSDLRDLNINPVTIPKGWGIKHIPNLMYAYFDEVSDEQFMQGIEEYERELLKEAKQKRHRKSLAFMAKY